MARPALQLIVRGRVQGVGYRWWSVGQAKALGLHGWVRNRRDGSVEILAIGSAQALDSLVNACGRGPMAASVSAVERATADDDGSLGFEQRPTI
jgi:acylphosphatase